MRYKFNASIATRLMLGYGMLVAISFLVVSAEFYHGTIGVLEESIDRKIIAISRRISDSLAQQPLAYLKSEINHELSDGIDSDTEIFLLLDAKGKLLAGNLPEFPLARAPREQLVTMMVMRHGKLRPVRVLLHALDDQALLLVGRDLSEQEAIGKLIERALWTGAGTSLLLGLLGSLFFRKQIESRINRIRRTAGTIEAGDLSQRIPPGGNDEFGRLGSDINRMLDRIEHLMQGVRHVSNAIAHDLRTPLGRIRNKLEEALAVTDGSADLAGAAAQAIEQIDDLILLFEKLLQIAQFESGMQDQRLCRLDLQQIAFDMVDLYEAVADERQISLRLRPGGPVWVQGDRNLLASALANLIDNAIKYAGPGARIEVEARTERDDAMLAVHDNGPGIPAADLSHVTERFYRVDHSRNLPGNGLGLSIVMAIATLHRGELVLESRQGLLAQLILPADAD